MDAMGSEEGEDEMISLYLKSEMKRLLEIAKMTTALRVQDLNNRILRPKYH